MANFTILTPKIRLINLLVSTQNIAKYHKSSPELLVNNDKNENK